MDWIKRATTVAGEPLKNYTDAAQEPTDGDREFLTFCKSALDINHGKWLLSLLDRIKELEAKNEQLDQALGYACAVAKAYKDGKVTKGTLGRVVVDASQES